MSLVTIVRRSLAISPTISLSGNPLSSGRSFLIACTSCPSSRISRAMRGEIISSSSNRKTRGGLCQRLLAPPPQLALALGDQLGALELRVDLVLVLDVVAQHRLDVLDRDLQVVGRLLHRARVLADRRDDLRHVQARTEQRGPSARLAFAERDRRMRVAAQPLLDIA